MKCKNCKWWKQKECKHPSLNVSGIFRSGSSNCDIAILSKDKEKSGMGFKKEEV